MEIIFYGFIGCLIMARLFWIFVLWPFALAYHFFWSEDRYRQIAVCGTAIPATLAWIGFLIWGVNKL